MASVHDPWSPIHPRVVEGCPTTGSDPAHTLRRDRYSTLLSTELGRGAVRACFEWRSLKRDAKQIGVYRRFYVGVNGRIRTGGDIASLNDLGSWNRKPIRGALLNSVQIQELVALNSAGNGYTGPLWSRYTT